MCCDWLFRSHEPNSCWNWAVKAHQSVVSRRRMLSGHQHRSSTHVVLRSETDNFVHFLFHHLQRPDSWLFVFTVWNSKSRKCGCVHLQQLHECQGQSTRIRVTQCWQVLEQVLEHGYLALRHQSIMSDGRQSGCDTCGRALLSGVWDSCRHGTGWGASFPKRWQYWTWLDLDDCVHKKTWQDIARVAGKAVTCKSTSVSTCGGDIALQRKSSPEVNTLACGPRYWAVGALSPWKILHKLAWLCPRICCSPPRPCLRQNAGLQFNIALIPRGIPLPCVG